jgi:hypothetical protein
MDLDPGGQKTRGSRGSGNLGKMSFLLAACAHNCRAADLGGEGGADGGRAARYVLIAAGLRHHGERVVPDRSPVLNLCTPAKETVSRDF